MGKAGIAILKRAYDKEKQSQGNEVVKPDAGARMSQGIGSSMHTNVDGPDYGPWTANQYENESS